jgi:hypothetical protein
MPLLARQFPSMTALCMKIGLQVEARSVYPSIIFIIRCILSRVTPVDVLVQIVERIRFSGWLKRHGERN